MKKTKSKFPLYLVVCIILAATLVLSILFAVTVGTVSIPFGTVYETVFRRLFGIGDESLASGKIHDVVWLIRLPRLILAMAVGAALSVSGLVMQAVVKNPIADPYVLGVSSGAYVGATAAIILGAGSFLGASSTGLMAFAGAFLASLVVVAVASIGGKASAVKLILAGTAVSAVCSAFSNFIIYWSRDKNKLQELVNWNMGSVAGASWGDNAAVLAVTLLGILFFWSQYRNLNLMLLGDDAAITLGTNLHRWRLCYLLVCALLVGFSVNSAGMIGFVGLVIPHVMRLLFGTDHKKLVPLCALAGSIFLVWADVLCRVVIAGAELPIGILTSMVGAPCFIYLIARKRYGFGGAEN
ncbi:MAG: FecCD family ABC transporter permease [Oscillospiraceae bacterium]